MTAPIRISNHAIATPLDGRGHRSPITLLHLSVRDHFLRAAAEIDCTGMSDRAAAAWLHTKLARYRAAAFRRDRFENTVPPRLARRIDALLWAILKVHDQVPCERLIRSVLSRS
jgi:hypothetical protein